MPPRPVAWEQALFPSAVRAAREGDSANAWLRALQESGSGIRRQAGLRIFGEAKRLVAEYKDEPTRPVDRVPTHAEARQWPTTGKTGVLQTAAWFYREHGTEGVIARFRTVKPCQG